MVKEQTGLPQKKMASILSRRPRKAAEFLKNTFSAATYNIHQWVGNDGIQDRGRILQVINALDADVIGLQEVSFRKSAEILLGMELLADATGFRIITGPTMFRRGADYGNILLTRHPIIDIRRIDMSVPGCEPRGAIDADLFIEGKPVRVIVAHLGLRVKERWYQINMLHELLSYWRTDRVVILADFNCWFPTSILLWRLIPWFGSRGNGRTFPSRFPLFALDRIMVRPPSALMRRTVIRTSIARSASDHLPVKAVIRL